MSILNVCNLTKTFSSGFWPFSPVKKYTVVNDISFALRDGEILGFLGPNGAGKTTTIQMLLGTLMPTAGSISYFGKEFTHHRKEILRMVSYASGYDALPARLTVMENLDIVGRIYGLDRLRRIDSINQLLKLFGMWNMRYKETGMLSAGQATRIMLIKAFLGNPRIVLLDEPTASLDPDIAHEVRQFILEQNKKSHVSLLVTSHNMDEVTEICDRVLVLKNGTIIADDTPEKLADSIACARVHLMISEGLPLLLNYLQEKGMVHAVRDHSVIIDVNEHLIAHFLTALAEKKISYFHISIDKPTLQDYFLSVAK
jgi:ABC-2 type transport system ATP-binding protein